MPGLPRIRKRTLLPLLSTLVLFLSVFVGATLVQKQQELREKAAPAPVLTESKDLIEARGELVVGFPELPVYPEAKLTYSSRYNLEEETVYRASWISDDSLSQIAEYYGSALRKAGWTVTEAKEPSLGDSFIEATKNNQTATLYIDQEGRGGPEDQEAPTRILVVIYLQQ